MDIREAAKNFEKRGFKVTCFETGKEAADYLNASVDGKTVGFGGSVTLKQLGLDESIAAHNTLYDHWKVPEGMTAMDVRNLAATAEVYMCSANGASVQGDLVNIDGTANRIASMVYGHKKYYFVIGKNKLAPTLEEAIYRARNVAAPLNAKRLGCKTPCVEGGHCFDCDSPARICNAAVIMARPTGKSDMEIVLVNEELGY